MTNRNERMQSKRQAERKRFTIAISGEGDADQAKHFAKIFADDLRGLGHDVTQITFKTEGASETIRIEDEPTPQT